MRTTFAAATVRLYHLNDSDPVAETLFYGPLAEAMVIAAAQAAIAVFNLVVKNGCSPR